MLDLRRFAMSWVAVIAVATVPAARAGNIQITVSDGVSTMKTYTGDTNSDVVTGAMLFADFHGELKNTSTITASSDFATLDEFRRLQLQTKLIGSEGIGNFTFTIKASETDFLIPPSNPKVFNSSASFTVGQGTGFSAQAQNYADPNNVLFGMAVDGGVIGPFTAPNNLPNSNAGNGTQQNFSAGLYSLTNMTTQMITSNTASSVDTMGHVDAVAVAAVPEPTTLLSLLVGVPALGIALARRRRTA